MFYTYHTSTPWLSLKKTSNLVRVSFIVITTVLLLSACSEERNAPALNPESKYIHQQVNERTFNDWTLEKRGFEVPVTLGKAVLCKIYNGQLFVWDGPSMTVKRYSLDGKLEATYGNGKGQGPGQFQHISSFAVLSMDETWVLDSRAGDITRFHYDGTLMERFRTEVKPLRMTVVNENRLVVQQMLEPKLFTFFNTEGKILKRFGKVLDVPQDRYSLILSGQLFPNPDGGFIWAPLYASYLYFYSADGVLERRIELIDEHSFPVDKMQSDPLQSNVKRPPQRTRGVSLTDEEIFVSVASMEPVTDHGNSAVAVMDRYDRSTGKYLDSKRIPFGGTNYLVHDGMMYGIAYSDTTLNKLRIHR